MNQREPRAEPSGNTPAGPEHTPAAGIATDIAGASSSATLTAGPSPVSELDQLVTVKRLREIVWPAGCRPSLQWLRKETKRRMLPHIRRGRLIYYRPRSVMEWFAQKESRPATMKN